MSLFNFQGEDIVGQQMRREKIRQTERDLRAQMDDDKKRHMRDEHRGEKSQTQVHACEHTHTVITNAFAWCETL